MIEDGVASVAARPPLFSPGQEPGCRIRGIDVEIGLEDFRGL